MGMKTREEDFVAQLIVDSTHSFLLCFTNTGRVYWLKVYEIPDVGAAGKGKSIQSLLDLQQGENVRAILPVRDLEEEGKFIFFATQKGTVKKTPLKDFSNVMSRGIIAIGIDTDDELVAARITDGKQVVFLATHEGMAIRFEETYKVIPPAKEGEKPRSTGLRPMGRAAAGNKGIALRPRDYVIGAAVTDSPETRDTYRDELAEKAGLEKELAAIRNELSTNEAVIRALRDQLRAKIDPKTDTKRIKDTPELKEARKKGRLLQEKRDKLDARMGLSPCLILTVTENGFGKRTNVEEYRLTSRGGSGVVNLKATPKVGKTSSILLVDETSELMVISQFGKIIRIDTKQVRAAGRATQGVRLLTLEPEDKVAAAVIIPPEELNGNNHDEPTLLQ
jgi:DNA gyrase subunit A